MTADQSWDAMTWKRRLETFGSDDSAVLATGSKGEVDAICLPGELTDKGRETTLALGQRIRKLYVDQLRFMPSSLDSEALSTLHLRSTPVPRALESLQQALIGLYPSSSRAPGLPTPDIVTRNMWEETLFPNEGACKRFGELAHAFANRTALRWNDSQKMQEIDEKIGKYMPKDSPVVKVDSHPRLSGIMDSINATLAHGPGVRMPAEFYDRKVQINIDDICVEEWFVGYTESNEYRKLGIGALVGDITASMVKATQSDSGTKLAMSGCHDTTLAAILTSLGAFQGERWPPFTSHIAVELFKRKGAAAATSPAPAKPSWWSALFGAAASKASAESSERTPLGEMSKQQSTTLDEHYVRLRFNDRVMTIPRCKPSGKHLDGDESFCTLAAFKQLADSFTPKNWREECKGNLGSLAVPATSQPPGLGGVH